MVKCFLKGELCALDEHEKGTFVVFMYETYESHTLVYTP